MDMTRTLTTLRWVPEMVRGLVRDVRLRWALEEAGFAYQVRLIGAEEQASADYRREQPFGQVPVYQEGDLILFESGAILHHIALQSPVLMPADPAGRARVLMWMFAAIDSVDRYVQMLGEIDLFTPDAVGARERRVVLEAKVKTRLGELQTALGSQAYLLDRFTAADVLMSSVLRGLRHTDLVQEFPTLNAYLARCIDRPAAQKALADHLAVFAGK